jgi:hypothetical protein
MVKRIFQYLQGTLQFKLRFRGLPPLEIVKYCDADWVNDLEDRRSTTWFVFMIKGGTISWSSKQQPIIVLSRTKVEYIASNQENHMHDKVHEGIKVHEREENDGD